MRNLILIFILISFLTISCNPSSTRLYQKFDFAIENGNLRKAKKILKKISSRESQNFLTLLKTAKLFSEKGMLDSAKFYIVKSIDFYKENSISHTRDFKIDKDNLYKMSISIYDKIIELDPNDANYCNRGILKKDVGLLRESIVDFSKAIQLDSSDYINYYNRGMAYRRLNILDSAILDYSRCTALNPNYGSAYLNKGFALLEQNEHKKALIEFQLALSKSENDIEKSYTLNNMGFAYYKMKEYELGYQFIRESLIINPINSYAYKNLALIDIALSNFKSACSNIKESKDLGFVNQYGDEIIQMEDKYCK